MRVLHLSTQDLRGGAARSAWRLHQGLLESGVESRMLVRTKSSEDATVAATDDGTLAALHEQVLTPWLHQHLPADAPWFTSGAVTSDISAHPWVQSADVLHLHWVAEWLSADVIASLASLGKPVIWTFHDLWAVTCGNHYAGSNDPFDGGWQTGLGLPEKIRGLAGREFERKHRLLSPLNIRVIAPSQWIGRMCGRSTIGSSWPVEVVPYGIDISLFKPADARHARERWNLPLGKTLLLFGCAAIKERRKGFHLLIEALQAARLNAEQVALVLFGADQPDLSALPIPAHHVGSVASEADMASLYAAASAYLCPTLEDNLPNTVLEAVACGVPVIGFATGGVPDLVRHDENGLLGPGGDVQTLAACLSRFVEDEALAQRLRTTAQNLDKSRFSLKSQAQHCLDLYRRSSVGIAQSGSPFPDLASLPHATTPPVMLPGEEDWLLQATAGAAQRATTREAQLRTKLDRKQAKLDEAKQKASQWKQEAKTAKGQAGVFRRKSWRSWFGFGDRD